MRRPRQTEGCAACKQRLGHSQDCSLAGDAAVTCEFCSAVLGCCRWLQVIDCWEPVTESDVQTPLEVYAELTEDGYDVVSAAPLLPGVLGGRHAASGASHARPWGNLHACLLLPS